jgi:2-methylisocitrate lyase-like PEP mutase family enzyme
VNDRERQHGKAARFAALHEGPCFVIPNPWDAGSARVLEALGFAALATTSSGFAFTLGRRDGEVTLGEVVAHAAAIDAATGLPLSVDLQNGYAAEPAGVAEAVRRIAGSGAVGCSIEDWDPNAGILDIRHAARRIAAAAGAARSLPFRFMLTARAENLIHGRNDLDDTINRLRLYEEAGADVLFAPGLRSIEQVRSVCGSVSKPVNVLATPSMSVADIAAAGARRISVGGRLTWVAVRAMADSVTRFRDGDSSAIDASLPLDEWFGAP